jgi:hypothetical protein
MSCRVLLTTIPKCGKNVMVSFFSAIGLARQFDDGDLANAASHAHTRWMLREQFDRAGGDSIQDIEAFLASTAGAFDRTLDALNDLPDRSFVQGHFAYDPQLHQRAQEAGISVVFLYRDPRACLASMAHFLIERGEPASLVPQLPSHDLSAAFQLLTCGNAETPPFEAIFAPYEGWRNVDGVIPVRFEDIVGPRGHGSTVMQASTLTALADRIKWEGSRTALLRGILHAFEPRAGTFRRGTLDGWRDDVTGVIGTPAWAKIDELARAWGYEDAPAASVAAGVDKPFTALLEGIDVERTAESEKRALLTKRVILRDRTIATLERERVELAAHAQRLSRRVEQLRSRSILRIADRVGHLAARISGRQP